MRLSGIYTKNLTYTIRSPIDNPDLNRDNRELSAIAKSKDSGAGSYIQRDFHFTKFLEMISQLQQVTRAARLKLCY